MPLLGTHAQSVARVGRTPRSLAPSRLAAGRAGPWKPRPRAAGPAFTRATIIRFGTSRHACVPKAHRSLRAPTGQEPRPFRPRSAVYWPTDPLDLRLARSCLQSGSGSMPAVSSRSWFWRCPLSEQPNLRRRRWPSS